jgi:hypothetical protein
MTLPICALCKKNKPDKKNTHFLTDAIIRPCLNEDGSNEREKGFYYDISTGKMDTEFNFQRGATEATFLKEMGRLPTDEENKKARVIPFSVDYIFCTDCENKFTKIEDAFTKKFLPEFREKNMEQTTGFETFDYKTVRMFFLLQVWRTSICTQILKLSPLIEEQLRVIIHEDLQEEVNKFLLNVTYLNTTGGAKEYTTNFVGYASGKNPYIIFMNDFVIQFFEPVMFIGYMRLYGINHPLSFGLFNNYKEKKFFLKVINNVKRKEILKEAVLDIRVKPLINSFANSFVNDWVKQFGEHPGDKLTQTFIQGLVDWSDLPTIEQLSKERVAAYIDDFFKKHKV